MRSISCPLCDCADHTPVCTRTRGAVVYSVVRCGACGFHYVNPEPDEPELLALYDEEYSSGHDPVWHGFEDALNRRVIRDLMRAGVRSLVDLGAGQGRFVHLAREAGILADGVEPSEMNCRAALDRYGIALDPRTVREYLDVVPRESVEAITMLNVLEHLPAPDRVLAQIRQVLRPGGRLVVIVPNVDFTLALGWLRRAAGFHDVYMLKSGRFSQQGFDPPVHLSSFSATHLRKALAGAGLRLASMTHAPVIRTRSRAFHLVKLAVAATGRALQGITGGRVVWGYSLYATAIRD